MSEIHITVDGVPITVPAGTNVVDAARTGGIAIPVFCYHPRMEAVGMCRMCLVAVGTPAVDRGTGQPVLDDAGKQVIRMAPKLMTGCTTPVSEGMVIYTQTEEVKFAQNGVLEFLLTSHPLDCPVCDKGGECPLQNLTMGWGPGNSRFDYTEKVHFEKPVPLGDLIYLDRERCILCGRCVRFQDELADDSVLGFSSRGRQWHIISKSDPPFDSKFSGNTTDICPVGALTTSDFRFQARAWELDSKPVVCNHCPVGCNMTLDMRHNKIMRVMPRENGAVNDIWICDKGRFAQHFVESEERLATPLIRRGDNLEPASWEEATRLIAEKFAAIHGSAGGQALAGLAGEHLSNEDLYLFHKLFREVLGSNNLDHHTGAPGTPQDDEVGAMLGVGSGTNLMGLGKGTAVLVFGADPEEEAPLYMLRLRAIANHGGEVLVANARPTKLDRSATMRLHYRPGSEVRVARALLSIMLNEGDTSDLSQRAKGLKELQSALGDVKGAISTAVSAAGVSEEDLRAVATHFMQAENGIILYGADALAIGPALTHDLGSIAVLTGKYGKANNGLIALLPRGNTRGALDVGIHPDKAAGYHPVAQPGLHARDMWGAAVERQVRGMYIMGVDPARDYPASRAALEKLEFLVVQDMFLTATAQVADVVLPAMSFAERDGTYTNVERRVQRSRVARPEHGESRPDWMIVQGVAQELVTRITPVAVEMAEVSSGKRKGKNQAASAQDRAADASSWDFLTVGEVAAEIAERVPGYAGITYSALDKTGKRGTWGRQTNEAIFYDGTNYENSEGVGLQYAAPSEAATFAFDLTPLSFEMLVTDEKHPFVLLVQRLLYDGDPLMRDSRLLAHVPAPYVAINTADAQRLGIQQDMQVRVSSAAGALDLPARIVPEVPAGSVLLPAHLPGAPLAAIQTGTRTRVAVSTIGE